VRGPIQHNAPWITDADRAEVDRVMLSGWVGQGREVAALEEEFAAYHGPGFEACAVSSGSAALYLALTLLHCEYEVVAIPTYACVSLLNAVRMVHGRVELWDCDRETFLPVPKHGQVHAAIIPHTYGIVWESVPHDAYVIEDCAQALGSRYENGRPVGTRGTLSVFSFGPSKMITGGGGGMLLGRADRIAEARRLRDYSDSLLPQAFNLQMSDMTAAMITSQFSRLPEFVRRRRAACDAYQATGAPLVCGENGYRAVLNTPSPLMDGARFSAAGIDTIVPIQTRELLHNVLRWPADKWPDAQAVSLTSLSLPTHPLLTDDDIERACSVLRSL